ncbi:arrestin [Xylariaceae sp. FL0255]|nr:arrestin [Xylariaceae sp. FL0255]
MPSFNPFASAAHRHSCSLFEIRLESDFIVFRGNDHEASGQLLKGTLVLCLGEPLKVEDVHLRLTGQCRIAWLDGRQTPSGIHNTKVDKTTTVLKYTWPPFVGASTHHETLAPGNYEWPFELELPGDTLESIEGLYQTGITYVLKATVARGKLSKNLHTQKRLRIVRTLDPAALEFNHAMSVENIWPEKIEYSLVIPRKAIVFGSSIPLEMRYTPLLKGLEMRTIMVKLIETQEFTIATSGLPTKMHKHDREITCWDNEVTREEHWRDNIEETGQEGWVVHQDLPLPKRLTRLIQDCTVEGIKIRHKLKLTVALHNPDGHVSELRATLPVTIFISPNMPLDDEGNIVSQAPEAASSSTNNPNDPANLAPPGYGEHILDQLYENVDTSGIMTPGVNSGVNTPFYGHSRAGSSDNLAAIIHGSAVPPAALTSRLQSMSLDGSFGRTNHAGHHHGDTGSGAETPHYGHDSDHQTTQPHSAELSRRASEEDHQEDHRNDTQHSHGHGRSGHDTPPEHTEYPTTEQLSKVPSYKTATKTPLPRTASYDGISALPDYVTAISAPSSPNRANLADPMETISERTATGPSESQPRSIMRNNSSGPNTPNHTGHGNSEGEGWLRLLQHRGTA